MVGSRQIPIRADDQYVSRSDQPTARSDEIVICDKRAPLIYPATKQTPMLVAARHTTSQLRRTAALRASVRTNKSGTLIPASMTSFAPLADTSIMKHCAMIDPWSSRISPFQHTPRRRERRFSPPDTGRSILKAE